jgi:hypothetical protein
MMEVRVTDKYVATMDEELSGRRTFMAPQHHPWPSTVTEETGLFRSGSFIPTCAAICLSDGFFPLPVKIS